MGFYIRKSISAGPFRFNLSGSGIGMSVGVKGFRIGTGPRGNYVHMGRGGIYYRASLNVPRKKRSQNVSARSNSFEPPIPQNPTGEIVETGDVGEMAPTNGSEILKEINEKLARARIWPWVIVIGCAIGLFNPQSAFALVILVPLAAFIAARWDQSRRLVVIMYDLSDNVLAKFESFAGQLQTVGLANSIWNIETSGRTADWKRNAGARTIITRKNARLTEGAPSILRTNVAVPCITGGRQFVYFLPDVVLVVEGKRAGALSYTQLGVRWNTTTFIEDGSVPSDSQVVGHTWRFVNKNGGPDRRFNNNRQIPEVRYQELELSGDGGLHKTLQLSKVADRSLFNAALERLKKPLEDEPLSDHANAMAVPNPRVTYDVNNPREVWFGIGFASLALFAVIISFFAPSVREFQPPPATTLANTSSNIMIPKAAPVPMPKNSVVPSFDCGRVHSDVLRLVCATPSLATLDRELAHQYAAKMREFDNSVQLRNDERAWIIARNNSPAEVAPLTKMYEDRIAALQSYGQSPTIQQEQPQSGLQDQAMPATASQAIDPPNATASGAANESSSTSPSTPIKYWYYCDSARAYYPYVQRCSIPWRLVSPGTSRQVASPASNPSQ